MLSIGWSSGRFEESQGQWKLLLLPCAHDEVLAKLLSAPTLFTKV